MPQATPIRRYAEAAEIEWEEIDVGGREDALPLHDPKSMPVAARIALGGDDLRGDRGAGHHAGDGADVDGVTRYAGRV